MAIEQVNPDHTATLCCPQCGREFKVEYVLPSSPELAEAVESMFQNMVCDDCREAELREKQQEKRQYRQADLDATLDKRLKQSGMPRRWREITLPPVRFGAEWVWRHREQSLVISGPTGTGKTSSVCFVLKVLMQKGYVNARYCTRQQLCADYIAAKTRSNSTEWAFWESIDQLDLLIIDELVGNKGETTLSDSSQELLFALVDGVYAQERKTKIWILGNFYKGVVDQIFNDPNPLKRRLNFAFQFAWFDQDKVDDSIKLE